MPASTSLPDAFPPGGGAGTVDFVGAGAVDFEGVGAADFVDAAFVGAAAVERAAPVGVIDFEADAEDDAAWLDEAEPEVAAAWLDEAASEVDAAWLDECGPAVGLAPRWDRLSQPAAKTARAAIRVPTAAAFGVCLMPHLRPAGP